MKFLTGLLLALFIYLQYKLWMSSDGVPQLMQLKRTVTKQEQENSQLLARNQGLQAEVADLKQGHQAIEERARSELGMIKQGEQFYQVVEPDQDANSSS